MRVITLTYLLAFFICILSSHRSSSQCERKKRRICPSISVWDFWLCRGVSLHRSQRGLWEYSQQRCTRSQSLKSQSMLPSSNTDTKCRYLKKSWLGAELIWTDSGDQHSEEEADETWNIRKQQHTVAALVSKSLQRLYLFSLQSSPRQRLRPTTDAITVM